ncbi:MAG: MFS transporter, partial [Cryobacterium sp.]|nr:MFS transporter [Cryobacterium sp.]
LIMIVPFGRMVDRFGRKRMMYIALAVAIVTAWPTFVFATSGNVWLAFIAFAVTSLCGTGVLLPTLGTLIIEQFRTGVRYTGASVGYQIAASLGGGLAPVIAASIMATTGGDYLLLSVIVIATLLVSGLAVAALQEMSKRSIAS